MYSFDLDLHSDPGGGGINFCYIAWRVGVQTLQSTIGVTVVHLQQIPPVQSV